MQTETHATVTPGAGQPCGPRAGRAGAIARDRKLRKDVRVLVTFVRIYCAGLHGHAPRQPVMLRGAAIVERAGRPVRLCSACARLLQHALVKRMGCPYDPKPMCKRCPSHCYAPPYRAAIREVMRYSGRRLVLSGRLDYLWHLLF